MVVHSTVHNRCLMMSTGRCQTLEQRTSFYCIHSSSNSNLPVGRK